MRHRVNDQAACQGCHGSKSQSLDLGWLQRVGSSLHVSPEALEPCGRTGNCLDVGIRKKEWSEFLLETGPLISSFNLKCRYSNNMTNLLQCKREHSIFVEIQHHLF